MWVQIALLVVMMLVSYLMRPKPKAPPPGTFEIPTTEEGASIGVLYGSGWITSPIIGWWGDTRVSQVKVKV